MIVTTAETVDGHTLQTLGVVTGNMVASRDRIHNMLVGMRSVFGGQQPLIQDLCGKSRVAAQKNMEAKAEELGADAVVAMRIASGSIGSGIVSVLCYGTAVKFI